MFLKILKWLLLIAVFSLLIVVSASYYLYSKYGAQLPDTSSLARVQYQTPLSVYSKDGQLLAEFGSKKRIPVTFDEVPKQLINAFVASEDNRFFEHPGVDYQGLLRASIQLLLTGKKKQGGSTITMQVARNYLLTREKTYTRKLKEIFLALKIEQELSKAQILELYLNKIFMGNNAYGVAAAAQVYYGRPLAKLSIPEFAMIAGLPKAPSKSNPLINPEKALHRRNYVLKRMYKTGAITKQDFKRYKLSPLTAHKQQRRPTFSAPYIAEMARYKTIQKYGDNAYSSGLKIFTTLDTRLQKAADAALRLALHEYDERHGYRGSKQQALSSKQIGDTYAAKVETVTNQSITAALSDQGIISINWQNLRWARPFKDRNRLGRAPRKPGNIVKVGDAIRVRKLADNTWRLTQVPEVQAALVALNPSDGAIVALSGGFDFASSHFNRASQAKRQPGSGFKPILYTHALEAGYTAASVINDAPIVFDDGRRRAGGWRPKNYSGRFYGPTRIRTALMKSRNLVSVRLLRRLGIDSVVDAAKRFGLVDEQLPKSLSLALGSGHATPLEMAGVYAVFANGGFKVQPYLIERIENYRGETVFQADPVRACPSCDELQLTEGHYAPRVMTPEINFIMNTLLRDVVKRGTATRALQLGRSDLAGKTGTTNNQRDAWFNGYTSTLTAVAWVGFDNAISLGNKETGGRAALPMWMHFMKAALVNTPEIALQPPAGVVSRFIDRDSGLLATSGSDYGVWEYFRTDLAPKNRALPRFFQADVGTDSSEAVAVESLF